MRSLIFISNAFLGTLRHESKIPLEFIAFAKTEGKMYSHARYVDTFVSIEGRGYANDYVYGAIFLLNHFEFYIRQLDAYHACSRSALNKNHALDMHHRVHRDVTPISFSSIHEFETLRYVERDSIPCHMYIGNSNHPKINKRLKQEKRSYRIIDGVHKEPFKQLIREVMIHDI